MNDQIEYLGNRGISGIAIKGDDNPEFIQQVKMPLMHSSILLPRVKDYIMLTPHAKYHVSMLNLSRDIKR